MEETSAPDEYKILANPAYEFVVNSNDKIIRKIIGDRPSEEKGTGEDGIVPIYIENKKKQRISFVKVDASDKKPLTGAGFEVWYKAKKEDTEYTKLKLYKKTADGKAERLAVKKGENTPAGLTPVKEDKFITGEGSLVEFNFYDSDYYDVKEVKAPGGYVAPKDFVEEFTYLDGKIEVDGRVQNGECLTEVEVSRSKSHALSWSLISAYDTSITMKYNAEGMPIAYTKDRSKLTLSGLPPKSQPTRDDAPKEAIVITAYLTDGTSRFTPKTITLNISEYSGDCATKEIDLYELVKELEGKATGGDIATNKTLILSMSSLLYLNNELGLGSKVVIGDKINEERGFHIGTRGDAYEDYSYSFTTKGTVDLSKPVQVKNRKATFPRAGALGIFGFLITGAIIITASYYRYRKKKRGRALSRLEWIRR